MNNCFNTRCQVKAIRLLLLGFLLSLTCSLYAINKDYTVKTVPNVRLQDRNNHVSNPDRILSQNDVTRINDLLNKLENTTSIEVAVVAVNSIGYNDARSFATELFNHWGIGKKKDDNGLLIQLITEPKQRSVVFEVGYGLEGVLPDVLCFRIQQEHMIDDLKLGQYSAGMVKGVEAVVDFLLASDYERAEMYKPVSSSQQNKAGTDRGVIVFLIIVLLILIWLIIYLYIKGSKKDQCPKCLQYKCFKFMEQKRLETKTEVITQTIYLCHTCGHREVKETRRPVYVPTYTRSYNDDDSYYYNSRSSSNNSSSSSSSSSSWSSGSSSSSSGSGSSGSSSSSSRSSGSSSSSKGSSYGGGRSGGGGAISRF